MLRSLFSGVSGMRNHQTRIDVIGNNIANVNTTGFKFGRVNFADQISQISSAASAPGSTRGGTNPKQVGLGVTTATVDTVMSQGNLQTTGKVTDLALQGDGFFILGDGPSRFYTRAGNFDFDREGNLVNPANGLNVMGWARSSQPDPVDPSQIVYSIDHTTPLQPLKVPAGAVIPPRRTTELNVRGNLDERIAVPSAGPPVVAAGTYDMASEVYDSLGNAHQITIRFTHTGAGSWTWAVQNAPDMNAAPASNAADPMNPLTFGANGLLTGAAGTPFDGGSVDLSWLLPDGSTATTTIRPNFGDSGAAGGMTQFANASTAVVADQNGYTKGELIGITIDKAGIVDGVFSNGRQQLLGQVAVASFTNAGGLMKNGDNTYVKTSNSGDALVREAGTAEVGSIASGALEMSNVDLAQQFSDMIVTQRGFQASSRVITTSDEILQELINLKR